MTQSAKFHLERQLNAAWPQSKWRDDHVLVAVSGGADSVALLRALLAAKSIAGGRGLLLAAHFNHRLRGDVADADQAWVEQLCSELGVSLAIGQPESGQLAAQPGDGWEATARAARYEFLRRTAEQAGARHLATAHTADDQVETVLHRILRGTGLTGLAGIPKFRLLSPSVAIVRPLLGCRRSEILSYLDDIGQAYRTDATNDELHFTRNRLRHELLPLLRGKFNADVDAAVLRLSSQAAEAQQWIAENAAGVAERCTVVESTDCVRVDVKPLIGMAPLMVREVFKAAWSAAKWPQQAMGFDEWQQLAGLVGSGAAKRVLNLPGGIRAERWDAEVVLTRE